MSGQSPPNPLDQNMPDDFEPSDSEPGGLDNSAKIHANAPEPVSTRPIVIESDASDENRFNLSIPMPHFPDEQAGKSPFFRTSVHRSRLGILADRNCNDSSDSDCVALPFNSSRLNFDTRGQMTNEAKVTSAPNTPKKPAKSSRSNENKVKHLKRKSISLNSAASRAIPRQKSIDEIAAWHDAAKIYDQMAKEDLVSGCVHYGMKKTLGKREMIIKLKEIYCYKRLHGEKLSGKSKTISTKQLDERIKANAEKSNEPHGNVSQEDSQEDSQDDPGQSEIAKTFIVSDEDDEVELTDEKAADNKRNQLFQMITENEQIHVKTVNYEPIDLAELKSLAKDRGVAVDFRFLIDFCDSYCISFCELGKEGVKGNLKPRARKKQ
jgi:hypothetical protein